MRRAFVILLTMLAFVASLFVVVPDVAPAKKRDAAIGAARLAMVHAAAKPVVRKAERTPAPAMTPRVFAVESAAFVLIAAKAPPKQWTPSAPDRSELMVFLN